ncbi:hypothetical protein K8R04_01470 [Candidatus Uhrbacteria bacterium]|nr:hypothetical protein [Candidatus Uhrbacteria bacterium]
MGTGILRHSRLFALIAFFVAVVLIVSLATACYFYRSQTKPPLGTQTAGFSTMIDPDKVLPCDGNKDHRIDDQDLAILKMYWKGFPEPSVDCNDDGVVHARDLSILLSNWSGDVPDVMIAPESAPAGQSVNELQPGDRFTASVLLSTGAIPIGAGEAVVSFNSRRLAVRNVRTSSGNWSTWIERPRPPYGSELIFAGGRVGGFTGSNVLIAEIEFEILQAGDMGLAIKSDASQAYQLDSNGIASRLAKYQVAFRPGTILEQKEPSKFFSSTVTKRLDAVAAPTRQGPRWIVDLSLLAPDEQIVRYYVTYEVAEGYSRSVQNEDVYALRNVTRGEHAMYVVLHDVAGNEKQVKASVVVP